MKPEFSYSDAQRAVSDLWANHGNELVAREKNQPRTGFFALPAGFVDISSHRAMNCSSAALLDW